MYYLCSYLSRITYQFTNKKNLSFIFFKRRRKLLTIAQNEQNNNSRPEISNPINDVKDYNPIIIGYPILHGKIPRIVINQIEKRNQEGFEDKNIILICTHEGSGFSSTIKEIKEKITNTKEIIEGKSLKGSEVDSKKSEIESFAKFIMNDDITNYNFCLSFKF